jgi:hypothetical protein
MGRNGQTRRSQGEKKPAKSRPKHQVKRRSEDLNPSGPSGPCGFDPRPGHRLLLVGGEGLHRTMTIRIVRHRWPGGVLPKLNRS